MLTGKTVLLGVTGGIAAYKAADLASKLTKLHCQVEVIMTKNATQFISPLTFETLTGHRCILDTFDREFVYEVEHIALAKRADLAIIAPATANVIGKMACGIADDMLTTTILACTCPKLVAPAMNTAMYENPVVQDNLQILSEYGFTIIPPEVGMLACKDVGAGKFPDTQTLISYIRRAIECPKDMEGMHVLVTAGPTMEAIDPVRYITNHSTGKMGYALAEECMKRGAQVTLVSGPVNLNPPRFVEVVSIENAREMYEEVTFRASEQDIIIKAAAVADYRPCEVADEKIKKKAGEGTHTFLELEKTDDILKTLGENKGENQFLCGFSMETENMLENSRGKLKKKNLDMIVANNLKVDGAGFGTDTNVVTLITQDQEIELEKMSKEMVAREIVNHILQESVK